MGLVPSLRDAQFPLKHDHFQGETSQYFGGIDGTLGSQREVWLAIPKLYLLIRGAGKLTSCDGISADLIEMDRKKLSGLKVTPKFSNLTESLAS